jgi:hypothetical protein
MLQCNPRQQCCDPPTFCGTYVTYTHAHLCVCVVAVCMSVCAHMRARARVCFCACVCACACACTCACISNADGRRDQLPLRDRHIPVRAASHPRHAGTGLHMPSVHHSSGLRVCRPSVQGACPPPLHPRAATAGSQVLRHPDLRRGQVRVRRGHDPPEAEGRHWSVRPPAAPPRPLPEGSFRPSHDVSRSGWSWSCKRDRASVGVGLSGNGPKRDSS